MLSDLPPIDWAELGIRIPPGRTTGNVKTQCPRCSHTRSDKRDPCLSVDLGKNTWKCHHCGWKGPEPGYARERGQVSPGADRPYRPYGRREEKRRTYKRPGNDALPAAAEGIYEQRLYQFFAERGISRETVDAFGITADGRGMHFPYYRDGELINVKHRWTDKKTGKKRFSMEADAELIFYNLDRVKDAETVYIVEGEMDVLALYEAGITNVISPPNGAPAPDADLNAVKFDYLASGEELFRRARKVVMAGDTDEPGRRLMDELARRIGKGKCWKIKWPAPHKDANEVLVGDGSGDGFVSGPDFLRQMVEECEEPYPVDGITKPIDYLDLLWRYEQDYEAGPRLSVWPGFSEIVRISEGQLSVWSGIPSSGKSVWLNNLAMHHAREHKWKIALFSPEYHPPELLVRDLVEAWLVKPINHKYPNHATREEITAAVEAISESFHLILPDRPSINEVMDRAETLVYREGIKMLIIDPWTEIDQTERGAMSMTDWVDICLKRFRRFGREFDVHVAVVAHPKKMQPIMDDEGNRSWPVVTPYDISDSRHWYEMADVIGSVFRDKNNPSEPVQVHVQKVRMRDNGEIGLALFKYDVTTHSYTDVTHTVPEDERQVTV